MPTITADAPHPSALPVAYYRYDAEGLLSGVRNEASTRYRYWRDDRAVAEIAARDSGAQEPVSWLWLSDTPLAEVAPASFASALLLATDASLSPMLEHADALNSIAYAPHGHRTGPVPPGADLRACLGFNGEPLDPASGLYLLGPRHHRAYSPALGMFLAPDAVSPFLEGGLNGYAYCEGDPVNRADPTGAFWKWIVAAVAVVTAVASLGTLAIVGVSASAVIGATLGVASAAVEVASAVVQDETAQAVLGYVGIGLGAAGFAAALPAAAKAGTALLSKGRKFLQRLSRSRPHSIVDKGGSKAFRALPIGSSRAAPAASVATAPSADAGGAVLVKLPHIDVVQGHGSQFLTAADGNVSGGTLASRIKAAAGPGHTFQRIELQSCWSAFGGKYASQAQRVADKLEVPTTGFKGRAYFGDPANRNLYSGHRRIMEPQTGWAKRRTALLNGLLSRLHALRFRGGEL